MKFMKTLPPYGVEIMIREPDGTLKLEAELWAAKHEHFLALVRTVTSGIGMALGALISLKVFGYL